jgi:competence protein ComEC
MSYAKRITALLLAVLSAAALYSSFSSPLVLRTHFLNVGQADCFVIQTPNGRSLLIDSGNIEDSQPISSYLDNLNIRKLDVVIGTHPHADHIGGMAQIIRKYEIGRVYMPFASNNTATFQDLLMAIKEKGLRVSTAKAGITIDLDPALNMVFLAPGSDVYGDLNNYSAVLKITYKRNSFLFSGDAGIASEEEMLRSGLDIKADVLKVAHHGSAYSTSIGFLEKVLPSYAIISVGAGNTYGHPSRDTLDRLAQFNVEVYRTDLDGTIIIASDGEKIQVDKKASPIKPKAPPTVSPFSDKSPAVAQAGKDDNTVYITRTGRKYHKYGCQYLSRSCIPIELNKAKDMGYTPCKVCKPPQ